MKEIPCGCCEGIEKLTPLTTANRPGLGALRYRIGTHATFLETMLARLSNLCLGSEDDCKEGKGRYPLQDLKTRERSDSAIALLDAWATVADVLTFYQERIANEGYLRTATERRSILELARLVGYELRPGAASSVYLAYTLEDNFKDEVIIPKGARSQSVPGPGELPQSFETSKDLKTRAMWNNLKPRATRPQILSKENPNKETDNRRLYLKGIATNLRTNDRLLFQFETNALPELYRVEAVDPDTAADRTLVMVRPWNYEPPNPVFMPPTAPGTRSNTTELTATAEPTPDGLGGLLPKLEQPPSLQPASSLFLRRSVNQAFGGGADTIPRLLTTLRPELSSILYQAMANLTVTPPSPTKVYALRTNASVFGHNAPLQPPVIINGEVKEPAKEWEIKIIDVFEESLEIIVTRETPLTIEGPPRPVISQTTEISIDGKPTLEEIKVTVEEPSEINSKPLTLTFNFPNYGITVKAVVQGGIMDFSGGDFDYDIKTEMTADIITTTITISGDLKKSSARFTEEKDVVWLDTTYPQIQPGSWIVLDQPFRKNNNPFRLVITQAKEVSERSRADYGITGKSTRVQLDKNKPWLDPEKDDFSVIRGTSVFAQSELLELAEEPIDPIEKAVCGEEIELDGLYPDLESGRWLIISGERTDITDIKDAKTVVNGIRASELVMLAGVTQDVQKVQTETTTDSRQPTVKEMGLLPGDKRHTFIQLAEALAYCYKRDTVTIYSNVVKATHGETRKEVLGSGDGAKALQSFTLKQPPLTFVSAPNPAGVDSTLKVFVNDVQWHEADALAGLSPTDRRFITKTDDDSKTTVIFGNGKEGARLPTGLENIKAEYRNGIGKPGNVKAEQISLLATKPLGVKAVINPLRASGGADREDRDQARKNAPLAVTALDRLVSVRDYEDFARTFAGISKANAVELSDGHRRLVHLTIAGVDDIPIDETSDLFRNLRQALHDFGDPAQPFQVAVRELMLLVISARVRILPDYQWESVVTRLRAALLDAFGFERRELGQDVLLSEVISVMQAVRGMAYVDVDALDALDQDTIVKNLPDPGKSNGSDLATRLKLKPRPRIPVEVARIDPIRPAQIAYLTPDVPDTLILNEVPL